MICAYCGKETNRTKEHIVSSSVLNLFPESNITYDGRRKKVYKSEPTVNDVCSNCNNNKLNYIDNYAKQFIERYFLVSYDREEELKIEYNYALLLKVLLKYAYNDLRANREDISFFDDETIDFLLDFQKTIFIHKKITILAGLSVNNSIAPDIHFGDQKLQWTKKPVFLENSLIENFDYHTGKVYLRESLEEFKMDNLQLSYLFKFNSGLFIILCWNDSSEKLEIIMKNCFH